MIGVEVFGRKPGFDPKLDSTVRSEAARLRARLLEYYATSGVPETLRITLPKGSYVPHYEVIEPTAPRSSVWSSVPAWAVAGVGVLLVVAASWMLWRIVVPPAPITVAVLPSSTL